MSTFNAVVGRRGEDKDSQAFGFQGYFYGFCRFSRSSRLYLDRMFEKNMRISIKNLNYRKRNSSRMENIHL